MARISRFSPAERHAAVRRAFGGDESPADVAHDLEVHPATLYRWANAEPTTDAHQAPTPTQRRLVQAAEELLREQDYTSITVEQVAEASGVGLRTAFHHFESKRDLFNAAIDHMAGTLADEMAARAEAIDWPTSPLEQLRLFLRVAAETAYARPEAHVLFRDLGVPPAASSAPRWHQRFDDVILRMLSQAAAAAELDPIIEPAAATAVMSSAVRGIHAAVFEGADPQQAMAMIDRLPQLVAAH